MKHPFLLLEHSKGTPARARWSSIAVTGAALVFALGVTPITGAMAQGAPPTPAQLDSIRQRLEDAEAAIEALREQLATEASTALRTRSRVALEFHGRVLMNVLTNSQRTNNVDVPTFVQADLPPIIPGSPLASSGYAMTIRQTQLGMAFSATEIAGGTFRGDLDVDFYGGQFPSSGGRTFPVMRLRTARGSLDWAGGSVMIGQEQPLITGLDPVSLATVGVPGFTAAGNLWLWLPQVRATVRTRGAVRVGLEAAVLAPTSGDAVGTFDTDFDAAERTGTPYVQAQARLAWGGDEQPGTITVGVHRGRVRDALTPTVHRSEAVAATVLLPMGKRLELRGEFFDGQALRGLGGGGIGQGISLNGPVRTTGGWGQLNARLSSRVLVGAGLGVDNPEDDDLSLGSRLLNTTRSAHIQWRPAGPAIVGFEWRSTTTSYVSGDRTNQHLNLALGFEF